MERILHSYSMKNKLYIIYSLLCSAIAQFSFAQLSFTPASMKDTAFWQEYHEAWRIGKSAAENEIRSIAVDDASNVWVATAAGIYMKRPELPEWTNMISGDDKGPAYTVITDDAHTVWLGTWNGAYVFKNNTLLKIPGTTGPVSALCAAGKGLYAFGPKGVWVYSQNRFSKKDYVIARSIRDAVADAGNGVWVASDVGLYHIANNNRRHFIDTATLISAYTKGLAFDSKQRLWVGGLGGISILQNNSKVQTLQPANGLPSIYVNCVERSPDNLMWAGTDVGIVRYAPDG